MLEPAQLTQGSSNDRFYGLNKNEVLRGFLIHGYADNFRNRLYYTGRLEDGRSFAAMESRWRPFLYICEDDHKRCAGMFASFKYEEEAAGEAFSGTEKLSLLRFSRYGDWAAAVKLLEQRGIPQPGGGLKPAELFLQERRVRLGVEIGGPSRRGRLVDMVFPDPEIFRPAEAEGRLQVRLKIVSIDIETDTRDGSIRAVGAAFSDSAFADLRGIVRVHASPPGKLSQTADSPEGGAVVFHPDETSLLAAFAADIRKEDPDILTGWNFLDFDFPRLADRCEKLGIPFTLGRSREEAKYFPASGSAAGPYSARRSAAALVPGRQVIDALRIVRSGPQRFRDYTLETVSQAVLGEGKTLALTGEGKIAELDRLYAEDPAAFGSYCYKDAALVLRIFAKTGLFRLTMERAGLTGVFLDKAWTSVVSFDRIYGLELHKRNIVPPPVSPQIRVSGAAGGTVLDPQPGLFNNVGVFDFRSLYPTIIRTFNIDPLAHARGASMSARSGELIEAPNGAVFSRERGPLPDLIDGYFASRRRALEGGDETAAHVYKILMNSFYGVLGTAACRYARTELAGAITSFARKWLLLSRDWFTQRGRRVLYGDTDSLFVETGLSDDAGYEDFLAFCGELAVEFNQFLAEAVRSEYRLESFMELRFEKAYRRFMIPPLRGFRETGDDGGAALRGRAKGYGGYLLRPGGGVSVEVKGMEAVRSDATPLARRVQLELLELVFSGRGEEDFKAKVSEVLKQLRAGELDGELIYRKRLSRPPESYTASTPPQVKAARALGWKGRRGTVEFVWTGEGPCPASLPHGPYDYDHYADTQVLPVVRSIAAAAGWDAVFFLPKSRTRGQAGLLDGQMELGL
jgi:DNA polymerase-2